MYFFKWLDTIMSKYFMNMKIVNSLVFAFFLFAFSDLVANEKSVKAKVGLDFWDHRFHHKSYLSLEAKTSTRYFNKPFDFLGLYPSIGCFTNINKTAYLYSSMNLTFPFHIDYCFTTGFGPGCYYKGNGKDLGFFLEFRSFIQFIYKYKENIHLGVEFSHLSNAGISKHNPGLELFIFFVEFSFF
jgi:hypothetical protein